MKRVLITGTSGFIGSRLAIRAAQAGHEVVATARRTSPELESALGMPVRSWDVLDGGTAPGAFEADALFHCATANDILSRDFTAGVSLSVNGTQNVLDLAVKNGIRNVVFFSTLQVYGTELEGAITEATPPHCESPYGLNHLLGEEVCRFYASKHSLNIVLLRPANVYGVPDARTVERSTLVPMCFVKTARQGSIVLQSSGRQQRNFISTDEVADVCLHLLENFPADVEVINAGSNWLVSIHELAQMVAAEQQRRSGTPLGVEILSRQPERGNVFSLESRVSFLRPSAEDSRERMRAVIQGLFDFLP
jgi:UDP-glucose 4-epimerase